jgi:hypothetical protein
VCKSSRQLRGHPELYLWQYRAFRAPGTTHACERFIPEKVYLTAGFETDLAAFCNLFQRELSNLLGQQCSRFVNCGWIRQQLAQTGQATGKVRNSSSLSSIDSDPGSIA